MQVGVLILACLSGAADPGRWGNRAVSSVVAINWVYGRVLAGSMPHLTAL